MMVTDASATHRSGAPTHRDIRSALPEGCLRGSLTQATAIFLAVALAYGSSFAGVLWADALAAKLAFSLANGLFIGLLFIIGHDCCHGSFTLYARLNAVLGRIAFLPSLHTFVCWELGHNRLHHGWTNLRGKDYVWTPFSVEDFYRWPAWRRVLERFYRSPLGVGWYYAIEIWWKRLLFPPAHEAAKLRRFAYGCDRGAVLCFFVAEIALVTWLAPAGEWGATMLLAVVLPQAIWHWLMGFVIHLHHTHPRVVWFDDEAEWSIFAVQVRGTVHVVFP